MVLLPDAILSNVPKKNSSDSNNFGVEAFENDKDSTLQPRSVLRMRKNNTNNFVTVVRLLSHININDHNQIINSNFTSINPILLKNMQSDHIIFEGNKFSDNIGTHGGAIKIKNAEKYQPLIILKNNNFTRNMAYFEGNAVFIKNSVSTLI